MRSRVPLNLRSALAIAAALGLGALAVYSPDLPPYPDWSGQVREDTTDRIVVAFRNDDLSVYSLPAVEDTVLAVFRRYNVPQTFAFIPSPGGYLGAEGTPPEEWRAMIARLRQWKAEGIIEFAQHGLTHAKSPHSAGEFDGLPHEQQVSMLSRGKSILDSLLRDDVVMFAPPWNQGDRNTLEACARTGLRLYSGYVGTPAVPGVTPVHTNAVLFPGSTGLPGASELYQSMARGQGTRFLIVFYHSRVDFPDGGAVAALDSLLSILSSDHRVVFTTLGSIPSLFPAGHAVYSTAGRGIAAAGDMNRRAKPYQWFHSAADGPEAGRGSAGLAYARAVRAWRQGSFREAFLDAELSYASSRGWIGAGRLVVLAVVLGLFWVAWSRLRSRGYLGTTGRTLVFAAALVLPVLAGFAVLRVNHLVSPMRADEGLTLGVFLLVGVLSAIPAWTARTGGKATPPYYGTGDA